MKNLTVKHLIRICDTTDRSSPNHSKLLDQGEFTLGKHEITVNFEQTLEGQKTVYEVSVMFPESLMGRLNWEEVFEYVNRENGNCTVFSQFHSQSEGQEFFDYLLGTDGLVKQLQDSRNRRTWNVGRKRVRDTHINRKRPARRSIKDSNRKFVKRKIYDSEEASYFYDTNFDEYPYIGEAFPLAGFPSILSVQVGDVVVLLPTVYPDEQQQIINSADQRRRFEIVSLFATTGADVMEMSGVVCGELIDCDN